MRDGKSCSLIENETHLNYYCNEGFNNCCSGSSTVSLKDPAVTIIFRVTSTPSA